MAKKSSLLITTALVMAHSVYASSILELTSDQLKAACHSSTRYFDIDGYRIYNISKTTLEGDFTTPVLKGIGVHPDLGNKGTIRKYRVNNNFIETLTLPLSEVKNLSPAVLSLITPELVPNIKHKKPSFMESIIYSLSSFRKSFLSFMRSSPSIKTPVEDLKHTSTERKILPQTALIQKDTTQEPRQASKKVSKIDILPKTALIQRDTTQEPRQASKKVSKVDVLSETALGQKDTAQDPRQASKKVSKSEPLPKANEYPIQTVTSLEDDIKVIMMSGGLPVQDSFLYKNARGMVIPNVPLINYYNPDFPLLTPLIISGQMSDEKYLQVVIQSRPIQDTEQSTGLLLRPHFAMHNSNKSPNYQVNLQDYNDKVANKLTLNGQYDVSTHEGEGGSIASPNNMPTGININAKSSLNRSTIAGWNDYLNKDVILTTYHIILESVSPTYPILDQIYMTNFNMDILLQQLKDVTIEAGSSQESADRFFNDLIVDLKNNKKQ